MGRSFRNQCWLASCIVEKKASTALQIPLIDFAEEKVL